MADRTCGKNLEDLKLIRDLAKWHYIPCGKQEKIRVVYIPYGIEIVDTQTARRDHFENFVVENSWRIFTCCEVVREEYLKYCRNREAVRALGSPKFDGTVHKENYPLAEVVKRKSGNRKIVLWKMHFAKKTVEAGKIVQITPELDEFMICHANSPLGCGGRAGQ